MKTLLIALSVALLTACGGDGDSGPEPVSVYFTIDETTCSGVGANVAFYLNGDKVGTEFMTVGGTSKKYEVETNPTVASAKALEVGGIVWPPATFVTPPGYVLKVVLAC